MTCLREHLPQHYPILIYLKMTLMWIEPTYTLQVIFYPNMHLFSLKLCHLCGHTA